MNSMKLYAPAASCIIHGIGYFLLGVARTEQVLAAMTMSLSNIKYAILACWALPGGQHDDMAARSDNITLRSC